MAEQYSSKGMMWKTIGVAVVLIAIIYPLTNRTFNSAADAAKGTDESDVRIQPIAKFELAKAEAAATVELPGRVVMDPNASGRVQAVHGGRIESVLDWSTVRKFRTGENPARWKGHLSWRSLRARSRRCWTPCVRWRH